MVFYPYEIKRVRQKDGCYLQDGVPVVESGRLDAYQSRREPYCTGTSHRARGGSVALYARVSSADRRDLDRQMQRLRTMQRLTVIR